MKHTILFLGTNNWACPILEHLHQEHTVVGVVTQPDKPTGRKQELTAGPVKQKTQELNLPLFQPEKVVEILDQNISCDFLVTVSYGQILPQKVLNLPKKDALNIHPSLLPRYRGATPMQSALLNGDRETAVSIIRMTNKMDAGPIFTQENFAIPSGAQYPELAHVCSMIGANLLSFTLQKYDEIAPQEQQEDKATYCKKLHKQDGLVQWKTETAEVIHNKLRAYTPWPGIYTFFQGQKLSLLDITPHPNKTSEHQPGEVFQEGGQILIQAQQGAIELHRVLRAGKKPMDAKSFLHGRPDFIGATLTNS